MLDAKRLSGLNGLSMKKTLLLLAFVVSPSLVHGAAVTATNYNEGTGRQRPISTISGAGILAGGVVAIGSWATDPVRLFNQHSAMAPGPASKAPLDRRRRSSWQASRSRSPQP
jgi:hypothetical protein